MGTGPRKGPIIIGQKKIIIFMYWFYFYETGPGEHDSIVIDVFFSVTTSVIV